MLSQNTLEKITERKINTKKALRQVEEIIQAFYKVDLENLGLAFDASKRFTIKNYYVWNNQSISYNEQIRFKIDNKGLRVVSYRSNDEYQNVYGYSEVKDLQHLFGLEYMYNFADFAEAVKELLEFLNNIETEVDTTMLPKF